MKKETISVGKEAMDKLRAVLYGDDDIRSFDQAIHQLFTELEQTTQELESELEASVEADPYLVRTYGKLNKKELAMLQQTICTEYINASRKSRYSKADWRKLGDRFGLELTD